MSRFARWLTRSVGRLVEAVPDGEGRSPVATAEPVAPEPRPEPAAPPWSRWLRRVADIGDLAESLPACAEEGAALLQVEACEIWLASGDATSLAAVWPPHRAPAGSRLGGDARGAVETGRSWRGRAADGSDLAVVPLADGSGPASGWLVVEGPRSGRSLEDSDLEPLREFASALASFLRCARAWSERGETAIRTRDNAIARQVHRGLEPRSRPRHPWLDVAGGVEAGESVAGGYYGTVERPDGSLALTVADVAGRGLEAALFLAGARGAIEAQVRSGARPGDLLARVNELLFSAAEPNDLSATACHLLVDPGAAGVVLANAGHPAPLHLSAGGAVTVLEGGGPALGVLSEVDYGQETLALRHGDLLVLYSEGLVRARGVGGTPYGVDRLVDRARRHAAAPASAIREAVVADARAHVARHGRLDEFVLVVLKALPTHAEASS
jgi:serine phosphatase RsbU (regulator of sigma subunit)